MVINDYAITRLQADSALVVLSESSFYPSYIAHKKSRNSDISTLSFIYAESKEFAPLMEFNKNRRILHYGFDPQVIGLLEEDIRFIVSQFELDYKSKNQLTQILNALEGGEKLENELNIFLQSLLKKEIRKLEKHLLQSLVWANEIARIIEPLTKETFQPENANFRDSTMAQNFLFWDDYLQNPTIIGLGAGAHLGNLNDIQHEVTKGFISMGSHLKYSDSEICRILFSSRNGSHKALQDGNATKLAEYKESLESSYSNYPQIIKSDSVGKKLSVIFGEKPILADWAEVYNYLVIQENVTPIVPMEKPLQLVEVKKSYRFVFVDSETQEPVPFAHLYFPAIKEGITANEYGVAVVKYLGDSDKFECIVHSLGYEKKETQLEKSSLTGKEIRVALKPNTAMMKAVEINSEGETPVTYLLKMRKAMSETQQVPVLNYYHSSHQIYDEEDTLDYETIVQYLNEHQRSDFPEIDILARKELDKKKFDKFKMNMSFPFMSVTEMDLFYSHWVSLYKLKMSKLLKRVNFEMNFVDSLNMIEISFQSNQKKNPTFRYYDSEGVLSINAETFLPVNYKEVIDFKGGNMQTSQFAFEANYTLINGYLLPTLAKEKLRWKPDVGQMGDVILESTSVWCKQVDPASLEKIYRTTHDLMYFQYKKKDWERFNEFVQSE